MVLPMLNPRHTAQRVASELLIRRLRKGGAVFAHGARFLGVPVVELAPGSLLEVGERARLISDSRDTALGVSHPVVLRTLTPDARIVLGDDVGISGGSICAALSVTIGHGTMLGANVTVADTDFHPVDHPARRYAPMSESQPEDAVSIGSNVFVGTGAIILKGAIIGDNCVVGAGAVVKGIFPAGSVIAGNPARVVRQTATV